MELLKDAYRSRDQIALIGYGVLALCCAGLGVCVLLYAFLLFQRGKRVPLIIFPVAVA